jgi:hypothetical protein
MKFLSKLFGGATGATETKTTTHAEKLRQICDSFIDNTRPPENHLRVIERQMKEALDAERVGDWMRNLDGLGVNALFSKHGEKGIYRVEGHYDCAGTSSRVYRVEGYINLSVDGHCNIPLLQQIQAKQEQ